MGERKENRQKKQRATCILTSEEGPKIYGAPKIKKKERKENKKQQQQKTQALLRPICSHRRQHNILTSQAHCRHIGGGGGMNEAYSRLSTTHGHITDFKLDSVVYAGVCVVI